MRYIDSVRKKIPVAALFAVDMLGRGLSGLLTGILLLQIFILNIFAYYSKDLPDYHSLKNYSPAGVTRIYTADGQLMAEYATEKRIYKKLDEIPLIVKQAFVAAEDKNFYKHSGVDIYGVGRAVIENIRSLARGSRGRRSLVGGSTITQQVVKNLLLSNEKTISRKIKEAILAFRVTRLYSKDRILELYLNEIYLGNRSYGVASAARSYFNKPLQELTTEEAALLAAMPKAPSRFNPYKNYSRALVRRNYVISRMYADGYINLAEAERAKSQPIKLQKSEKKELVRSSYFAEEVRRQIAKKYGKDMLYKGGLYVKTTMVPRLQKIADDVLRNALISYDKRHGYRGPIKHLSKEEMFYQEGEEGKQQAVSDKDNNDNKMQKWRYVLADMINEVPVFDGQQLGVVLEVKRWEAVVGLIDGSKAVMPFSGMKWARKVHKSGKLGKVPSRVSDVLSVGDIVLMQSLGDGGKKDKKKMRFALIQVPEVDGAIIAVEADSGKILAMSGGYNPNEYFNRATQARRQPGSVFKPFVYLSALEHGFTPSTIVVDGPIEIYQGDDKPMWRPKNYGGKYLGPTTLRRGLEKSRNLMTVRLAQMLTIDRIIRVGQRFGIYPEGLKANYSMSLGSVETTLRDIATGYAMIVNGGMKIAPTVIERIDAPSGEIIYKGGVTKQCSLCSSNTAPDDAIPVDKPPRARDIRKRILDPRVAYQINYMMQGVVQRGTAAKARVLGFPVGGKTGTTNNSRDAWFVGYSSDMVVGVYIGFDKPKSLGRRETGGKVALPAFIEFMKRAYADAPPPDFEVPKGIRYMEVEYMTGQPPLPWHNEPQIIKEAFIHGGDVFIPDGEEEGLAEVIAPYSEEYAQKFMEDYNEYRASIMEGEIEGQGLYPYYANPSDYYGRRDAVDGSGIGGMRNMYNDRLMKQEGWQPIRRNNRIQQGQRRYLDRRGDINTGTVDDDYYMRREYRRRHLYNDSKRYRDRTREREGGSSDSGSMGRIY